LFVGCTEFVEQVKSGVHHFVWVCTRLVHFVHHDDGLQAQGQSFLGHETSLRHGAFLRIDQQHNAVHHRQGTFHFATEVRVTRGVNDIDVCTFPAHSTVLGQNRDAAFAFDSVVVHHSVDHFFVVGEGARLTQQLVNHGCFTVVNVGDDGDVANLLTHASLFLYACSANAGWFTDELSKIC
jgi:hypothetical protein